MNRTDQQNKALHVWLREVGEELNAAGLDMRKTLKQEVEIPWTEDRVKEFIWYPVMEAATGKESTTKLTTVEISEVHDILSRHLGEKFSIYVPWPSYETDK
jgi:hypothetical protein